jgi:hypothetical protein
VNTFPVLNPEWLSRALEHLDGLVIALQRLPGQPHVDALDAVRRALAAGQLDHALQHCAAIPWLREQAGNLHGLQIHGAEHSLIDHHARATALALARLSLEHGVQDSDPVSTAD